jgi:hypothetical protein
LVGIASSGTVTDPHGHGLETWRDRKLLGELDRALDQLKSHWAGQGKPPNVAPIRGSHREPDGHISM